MTRLALVLAVALAAGCALTPHSPRHSSKDGVDLRLTHLEESLHVVFYNMSARTLSLYRDALSLRATDPVEIIPPYPKVFPPEKATALAPMGKLEWAILVKSSELYPYSEDRGGIRLGGHRHTVSAVYRHHDIGALESNDITFTVK